MKYKKWFSNNIKESLIEKEVLITGATGGIGKNIARGFLHLKAKVILPCRNMKKGEAMKEELLKDFPGASITIIKLDLSSIKSIDGFVCELEKEYNYIDYLINNAGIYHLPSIKNDDNIEIHLATNAVGPTYLTLKLIPLLSKSIKSKIITVSSLSYRYARISIDDIEGETISNKTKLYANTKRVLMSNMLKLKRDIEKKYSNISLTLIHPGVCATNLFDSNKGGFTKAFNFFIVPFMKLIFFSPAKASLNVLYAINNECKLDEWITPRGLMEVWGYPKINKLDKSILDINKQEEIFAKTLAFVDKANLRKLY